MSAKADADSLHFLQECPPSRLDCSICSEFEFLFLISPERNEFLFLFSTYNY